MMCCCVVNTVVRALESTKTGPDPRADVGAQLQPPPAYCSPHSWMPCKRGPRRRHSPASRLIDREVRLPSVQCCELMGFCSPGQIPGILLVPEHVVCGAYEKRAQK